MAYLRCGFTRSLENSNKLINIEKNAQKHIDLIGELRSCRYVMMVNAKYRFITSLCTENKHLLGG